MNSNITVHHPSNFSTDYVLVTVVFSFIPHEKVLCKVLLWGFFCFCFVFIQGAAGFPGFPGFKGSAGSPGRHGDEGPPGPSGPRGDTGLKVHILGIYDTDLYFDAAVTMHYCDHT